MNRVLTVIIAATGLATMALANPPSSASMLVRTGKPAPMGVPVQNGMLGPIDLLSFKMNASEHAAPAEKGDQSKHHAPHQDINAGNGHRHQELVITKALDKCSPMLAKSLGVPNDVQLIQIDFTKPDKDGKPAIYHTIRLYGATITKIDTTGGKGSEVETITLTFRRIEHQVKDGKKSEMDDWQKGAA